MLDGDAGCSAHRSLGRVPAGPGDARSSAFDMVAAAAGLHVDAGASNQGRATGAVVRGAQLERSTRLRIAEQVACEGLDRFAVVHSDS
jgi:hypothetical protein